MNTQTILRVAQAICDSDSLCGFPNWDKLTPSERGHYIRRAEAAVETTEKSVGHYGMQLR